MTRHLLFQRLSEVLSLCRTPFQRPTATGKVFCIGYLKTGSTSVGMALRELGYRHLSFNSYAWRNYEKKRLDRLLALASRFDAFDDLPWFREDMIPVLEEAFPDSKFIDLVRDEAAWAQSMATWSKKMFGRSFDADRELEAFRKHKDFVRKHFANHPPDRFLTLDVTDPEGFEKLAGFLGKSAPHPHFPHLNRSA